MVSRFLFGLCNEQNLGMLRDCVKIEEGRNDDTDRERIQKELQQLALKKLCRRQDTDDPSFHFCLPMLKWVREVVDSIFRRRRQDTDDGFFHSVLPTLKWVREMGDSVFTTKAIKEAAACLGDEITIGGGDSPILPR